MAKINCVWCKHPDADETWLADPAADLCHGHLLEYDGMSEDSYAAMLAGEAYDSGAMYH